MNTFVLDYMLLVSIVLCSTIYADHKSSVIRMLWYSLDATTRPYPIQLPVLIGYTQPMKILFIHRSVGHHLIEQGSLRQLMAAKGFDFDDYDNNDGILTQANDHTSADSLSVPGGNTNPENLDQLFKEWPSALDTYDLIAIKSCYPNSHIKSEAELGRIKNTYSSIVESFSKHSKKLLIITSPPLRPLFTNKNEASLASVLADWLATLNSDLVTVFDFHRLLSEPTGRHKGMLRREYRRLMPFDNHPNRKAHIEIAPLLLETVT